MASRLYFLSSLLIVLLLLTTFGISLIPPSRAQSPSALLRGAPSFIDIGLNPGSLAPLQQGAPIFTVNDSLWIYSSLDAPVQINLENPANASITASLNSPSAVSLHTFSDRDSPGVWTLHFILENLTTYAVPITFVGESQISDPVSLNEYSIQNGEINLGFSVAAQNYYDLEACLTANASSDPISLSDPATIGTGGMSIALNGTNGMALVTATGKISSPFSFWFDLEYPYAYTTDLANATITRSEVVAQSSPVLFNASAPQNVTLPLSGNLRSGRYVIRGYFDSSSGFTTADTRALHLEGSNWFWLSSCNPFTISGDSFTQQVNLAQSPSSWPTQLYFMYQDQGIENFAILPLEINLARLDFLGQPGNVPLSGFTYSISNNSDIEASGGFSGSLYFIAKSFPVNVTVVPSLGSEALGPINVNVSAPLTDSQYFIPIGKLTVKVLNNSKADEGASVSVTNSEGASLSNNIPAGGNTSFYVPAGFFNIDVTKSGVSEYGNATVIEGSNTIVTISFTSAQIPRSYLELLLVPLILGLALNVWAWVISPRRSKFPMNR